MQPDYSVNVIDGNGAPAGHFDAPWAKDNAGNAVATSYLLDGNTIVQTVAHSGNYPVVADPKYTWGWVTGTAYYNKAETRNARTLSGMLALAATLCLAVGPATAGIACAVGTALAGVWAIQANNAVSDFRCFKVKYPTMEPGTYAPGNSAPGKYCY